MSHTAEVTRLRVSHVSARIHDSLREIGEPVAFGHRLATLGDVRGLPLELPFGPTLAVDSDFWSTLDNNKTAPIPVPEDVAPRLRRAGVPLRVRGTLTCAEHEPRLELHLHPFGVVAMTTVDLSWTDPVRLDVVSDRVRELEIRPAEVSVGPVHRTAPVGRAAEEAARAVVDLLTVPGSGQSWDPPGHRLATVISGRIDPPVHAMPLPNSPLHVALHRLCGGGSAVSTPGKAFVAQWTGSEYTWPSESLVYMLDQGTAILASEMADSSFAGQLNSTGDRHRRLLLMISFLTATTGLLRATPSSQSGLFPDWADTFARLFGRLFGPAFDFRKWGLMPRILLERMGANEVVEQRLGAPLTAKPEYPTPDYPAAAALD
jgi:hypothetical protein